MKLIQTPSIITGAILGASLITLSAAGSNAGPEDLKVFVPGTTVSSVDVNANFTYLDDEVTTLEGRVEDVENTTPFAPQYVSGSVEQSGDYQLAYEVPAGKMLLVTNVTTMAYGTQESSAIMRNPSTGDSETICKLFNSADTGHYTTSSYVSSSGYVIPENCYLEIYCASSYVSWTGTLIDAQ